TVSSDAPSYRLAVNVLVLQGEKEGERECEERYDCGGKMGTRLQGNHGPRCERLTIQRPAEERGKR
ncbi:hypothetical protein PFISCL1PPCAC_4632, partial [Pristionchus fissidentatus]